MKQRDRLSLEKRRGEAIGSPSSKSRDSQPTPIFKKMPSKVRKSFGGGRELPSNGSFRSDEVAKKRIPRGRWSDVNEISPQGIESPLNSNGLALIDGFVPDCGPDENNLILS
jgi:hypothetical protein